MCVINRLAPVTVLIGDSNGYRKIGLIDYLAVFEGSRENRFGIG
jgi:hypothetical protein